MSTRKNYADKDHETYKKVRAQQPPTTRFIDVNPDKATKDAIRAWAAWDLDADGVVEQMLDAGHALSVKEDAYNNCWACYVFPGKENRVNEGRTLVGRGSTPLRAVKQACFAHFVLFDGTWPEPADRPERAEYED